MSLSDFSSILDEFADLERQLADPQVTRNPANLQRLGREHMRLEPIVGRVQRLATIRRERRDAEQLVERESDPNLKQLALEELGDLEREEQQLLQQLDVDTLPHDPADERDAILEIRAGAGGDEAGLFAAD